MSKQNCLGTGGRVPVKTRNVQVSKPDCSKKELLQKKYKIYQKFPVQIRAHFFKAAKGNVKPCQNKGWYV